MYSQIPTSGSGDFTVTRATSATRVNASGLIESVASGIPRLDYFASGGVVGCPALLVEPSATNFVPSGTNVAGDSGLSRTATTTSPAFDISGTIIAKTVTGTTNLYASQTCLTSLPSGSTTYTISRFFKYNGTDLTTSLEPANSAQFGNTLWNQKVVISAASGVTLGISTACTGSVDNFGNGWYRVSARFTTGATPSGSATVNYLMIVSGSVASGSSFITALPQLEASSVATSYIPTTTAAVTRNADVISVSGAVSGAIGQTEGTIYAEVDYRNFSTASQGIVQLFLDASNRFGIAAFRSGAINGFQGYVILSGNIPVNITSTITSAGIYKLAFGYKLDDYVLYINGTQIGADTSGGVVAANTVHLGHGNGLAQLNDRIRAVALYTTRLTNAQLASLTT